MSVSFNQNLNVEFHQTFEADEPFVAVHIGIRCGKVTPHKGIARQQQLFLGVVQHDVVVAVAGSSDNLQGAGFRIESRLTVEWRLQVWGWPIIVARTQGSFLNGVRNRAVISET